jgi:hypothetical protein
VFPFKERGLIKADVYRLLEESGIGLPDYYKWRSRSGCFFCFFQRKYEWVKLSEVHPLLFAEAVKYEKEHSDGRVYTWTDTESLTDLLERKDKIISDYEEALKREKKNAPNKPLSEVFGDIMDGEDLTMPCLMCNW